MSVAFREIKKQFATEFDYRGEYQNQVDVKRNLEKVGHLPLVPRSVSLEPQTLSFVMRCRPASTSSYRRCVRSVVL